jgi:hypothetical protein
MHHPHCEQDGTFPMDPLVRNHQPPSQLPISTGHVLKNLPLGGVTLEVQHRRQVGHPYLKESLLSEIGPVLTKGETRHAPAS